MVTEYSIREPGRQEAPLGLAQHSFGVRDPSEAALARVSEALKRETSFVSTVQEPQTSAIATLVTDDALFTYATGGMLIRNCTSPDIASIEELTLNAKNSARLGSWKSWLSGLPLCGGKLIVGIPDGLSERDLHYVFDWIGEQFQDADYYGKPDFGTTASLLAAYANGGGKISTADLNCKNSTECEPVHWKRLAKSVVEGISEALEITLQKSLSDAKVLLVGAQGKIGGEILGFLEEHNAKISLLVRDSAAQNLALQAGLPYCTWDELPLRATDVLIWAGPPFGLKKEIVQNVQALLVGGPANDAVATPDCYHLGKTIIPGAVLTSASMYVPTNIPGFEDIPTPTLDEVGLNSRKIVRRVFDRLKAWNLERPGDLSLFEAFVLESESAREACASKSRALALRRNFKDTHPGEGLTFGNVSLPALTPTNLQ